MFRILAEKLKIERGALLLTDPASGEFAPWSMKGLDRTSEHRLRIPERELTERVLQEGAAVTVLDDARLRPLEPYLSQREFGRLSRAAIVPFSVDGRILGLLLITASPYLDSSTTVLDVAFSAIARPISGILHHNRDARLEGASERAVLDEGELLAIAAETRRPERGTVAVIGFDIDPIVGAISGGAEDVDRFRIRQDVLRVVAAMVADSVTMGTSAAGHVILLIGSDAVLDPDMVLHQISVKLAELFDEIDAPPDLNASVRRVESDTDRPEEVLSELL